MALSSSSTFSQIEDEYLDTAGYETSASASEARRHATAIRFLLLKLPSTSIKGSNTVSYDMGLLRDELDRALQFARSTGGGAGRVIRADFRQMRKYG